MSVLSVTFTEDATKALAALRGEMVPTLRIGVLQIAAKASKYVKDGLADDEHPHTRSGALARSWTFKATGGDGTSGALVKVDETETGASVELRSALEYAAIHEFGGIVKAKTSKYLAIPLGPAKTPAGVAKFSSPRQAPVKLQFIQTKKGNKLLVEILKKPRMRHELIGIHVQGEKHPRTMKVATGIKDKFIAWYLLREQVYVPARRYVSKAVEKTEPDAVPIMDAVIVKALRKANL